MGQKSALYLKCKLTMRVLIVEDDVLIAEHLKEIIEEKGLDEVELANSAGEARDKLNGKNHIDLVLLDINMEEPESGINLAIELNSDFLIPFMYITAQSDAGIIKKAAATQPLSYIVKPFMPLSVQISIELAREKINDAMLIIRDGYKELVIPTNTIIYGQSNNNYIEIFGTKKKWVVRITMKELMELLPQPRFFQVHRSYFINTNYIDAVLTNKVSVRGNILPVSKAFESALKDFVN